MTCIATGCMAGFWRDKRPEMEAAATEAGWRHWLDNKTPQLSAGACLCPAHADQAQNFVPAKARTK